ncbi:hypothetical protein [Dasineura jujubifolia toursvirus 2a]|nr:hypothetical protein [Dasineura jujubifolia toursvirus 2a]
MTTFNFDSESNVTSTKIPSVKAINKLFCNVRNDAGIWCADDNMLSCGWRTNCNESCESSCVLHFVNTKPHVIQASTDEVMGRGIQNPRMCIIRRSKLLKLTAEKGRYCGLWVKGDGEIKENGIKKYSCARRYLVVFLDEKNKPLHTEPIQLTAKGNFQMSFDNNFMKFREDIHASYCKSMKRARSGKMNEEWYAMCVYAPTFESKLVGKDTTKSHACVVSNYIVPTETTWTNLCVGRDPEVSEKIHLHFIDSEPWAKRFNNNPTVQSPQQQQQQQEDEDFE